MHLTLKFDTEDIDWKALAAIYEEAEFEGHTAESLKANFEAAEAVCFDYNMEKIVGAVRMVDGKFLDFCISKYYLGFGPGQIMYDYLCKQTGLKNPSIIAAEGAERDFLEKAELTEYLA